MITNTAVHVLTGPLCKVGEHRFSVPGLASIPPTLDDMERNHIKTCDCFGDQTTLGLWWNRWLTPFQLFADGKGLIINEENANNKQRRRALLLHLAGPDVQDIFSTLPDTGYVKDYKKAVETLNVYFVPRVLQRTLNTPLDSYHKHPGRILDSLPQGSDEQRKTVVVALKQTTKYGMKSRANARTHT